ncbi:MAG: hypothetical protein HUJ73_07990 [Eubacterium sp.]|nr:hypothetical protein [Eubacterium sp.]
MAETLFMAIDLGTSFIKTGVYAEDSECLAAAMEPVRDYRPGPGIFIQKGEELFASVLACMKKVTEQLGDRAGNIAAISFTGQMSGFMGVDENWNDITTWSCSLDSRYMPYAQRQMKELKDAFYITGGTNFPQMAPKSEWFRKEFPEESAKIRKYLMISGYVIGKLGDISVEESVMDRSYTQWTGLADVQAGKWSEEICSAVGMEPDKLPKIVNSNTICAHLRQDMAEQTGLKSGIPLVSGAGDKAAGCLGAAIVHPGDLIFEAGSYGAVSCCVKEWRPDMEERRYDMIPSAVPGDFLIENFITGSGITLDWFIDTFVKEKNMSLKDAFSGMEDEMESIPIGCSGLMSVGLLSGSSMPLIDSIHGMWMGFDWSHSKAHFYKSLMESLTYDFGLSLERMKAMYPEYEMSRVSTIGGGAKSRIWPQMCADAHRKIYGILNREDVAMWGACILAGNAVGIYPDIRKAADENVWVVKEFIPDEERSVVYDKYGAQYDRCFHAMSRFYNEVCGIAEEN